MEVIVIVEVEDLYSDSPRKRALSAYFTMVALNAGGKPMRVLPLELKSDEERQLFEAGRTRYETYKNQKGAEGDQCHVPPETTQKQ